MIGARLRFLSAWLAAAALLAPLAAIAQEEALSLRLRRTFGYSGGGDIQGSFLLIAEGTEDLEQVTFYVDEVILDVVEAPPFQARLHTGDFAQGPHRLWAEGRGATGRTLHSNTIHADFVSSSASWQAAAGMLVPVVAIVGAVMLGGAALMAVTSRSYRPGIYGRAGGAICRHCRLPMARHVLAPNLVRGKLERCPHCGKWSLAARATAAELAQAEARLTAEAEPLAPEISEQERLRRQLDDSRFVD